jgi:signal transduction protein with GAF and PtsI domain
MLGFRRETATFEWFSLIDEQTSCLKRKFSLLGMGTDASKIRSLEDPQRAIPKLRPVLDGIVRQVQTLLSVPGALVLLVDERENEFYVPAVVYESKLVEKIVKNIRFPIEDAVVGKVCVSGEPLIVDSPIAKGSFCSWIDKQTQYHHDNMLVVPLRNQYQTIGVLCAVNKKTGSFDQADVEVLAAVANLVVLTIENNRISLSLAKEYENVRGLNQVKEQAIHHLSHEMKTPISVLTASLSLLEKRLPDKPPPSWRRIMDRARRNLNRLLDLQYEIGDMLRKRDF